MRRLLFALGILLASAAHSFAQAPAAAPIPQSPMAVSAPTAASGDSSYRVANTAFVQAALSAQLFPVTCLAHQWVNQIGLAASLCSQPAFTDISGSLASSQLPSPFTNGTASGNTTKFMTGSGAFTNGDLAKLDANGNVVDGGAPVSTTYPLAGSTGLTYVGPTKSGRLTRSSATALSFAPYYGDIIRIAGTVFQIPSGGIAGCNNTSVFVDGVAAQNLAASTLYYVYAFSNSGAVTCDFSTTGHATDTTAGNVGTEIKSGVSSRSLIGAVFTNASNQFDDSSTKRNVASWFNRVPRDTSGVFTAVRTITNQPSFVEVNTEIRTEFVAWANSTATIGGTADFFNTASGDTTWAAPALSSNNGGAFTVQDNGAVLNGSTAFVAGGIFTSVTPGEGHWMLSLFATINTANTASFQGSATAGKRTGLGSTIVN